MSRRNSPNTLHVSDSTISFTSLTTISSLPQDDIYDIYDKFIELFINSDIKQKFVLITNITNSIKHLSYIHILKTMDNNNVYHVIGYLKSQHSSEMYNALEYIISLYNNFDNISIT